MNHAGRRMEWLTAPRPMSRLHALRATCGWGLVDAEGAEVGDVTPAGGRGEIRSSTPVAKSVLMTGWATR